MAGVRELTPVVGNAAACRALGLQVVHTKQSSDGGIATLVGNTVTAVDVSGKDITERTARAAGFVKMTADTLALIEKGTATSAMVNEAQEALLAKVAAQFPDAKFVHIVRDPFVIFPSTVHLWKTLYSTQGMQKPRFEGLDRKAHAAVVDEFRNRNKERRFALVSTSIADDGVSVIAAVSSSLAGSVKAPDVMKQLGLRGGVRYHDGQFDDARLLIDLVKTAAEQGATLLNYARVTALRCSARLSPAPGCRRRVRLRRSSAGGSSSPPSPCRPQSHGRLLAPSFNARCRPRDSCAWCRGWRPGVRSPRSWRRSRGWQARLASSGSCR